MGLCGVTSASCCAIPIVPLLAPQQCSAMVNEVTPVCNQGIFAIGGMLSAIDILSKGAIGTTCASFNSLITL